MVRFRPRYLWFYLALVLGSLLGLLVLVQSVTTYYQVSRFLIAAELRREAQRQVSTVEREARRLNIREPAELAEVFRELREEAPKKIAWFRVTDAAGRTLIQVGDAVGEPFTADRLWSAFELAIPVSALRRAPEGEVLVTVFPLRLPRRPPPAAQEPRAASSEPMRPPERRPGPRFIEVALYTASASANFGRLLTNLIVNSSAALGLVASMIILWLRFPDYVRGKQLEQQTELARRVQTALLPPPEATFSHLDFAAGCIPAWQVGGDFFDVFASNHQRIAIVLGDVSGKGLPASVLAGLLLGAVRSSDWFRGRAEHETASRSLSELLRMRTGPECFASLFWCYYDTETRLLHYVNAGHLPPLVVHDDPDEGLKLETLEEGGPVLGLIAGAEYEQGAVPMTPGDLLVLYSDGLIEATNAAGAEFGEERLRAAILENAHDSCVQIRDEILKRVQAFMGRTEAQDDLTLVVARIRS